MVKLSNNNMAKSCLIAAVCASARRSARSVSAFTASRLPNQALKSSSAAQIGATTGAFHVFPFGKESVSQPSSSTLFMSTTTSSTENTVIKRVKTADATPSDEIVAVKGWVRTVRKQKTLAFVEVNDGSSLAGIQCVLPFDDLDEASNAGMFHSFLYFLYSTYSRYYNSFSDYPKTWKYFIT